MTYFKCNVRCLLRILFLLFIANLSILAKDTLIFAPLPMLDKKVVFDEFYPMKISLEKKLNKKIDFYYAKDYAELLKDFESLKIDLIYLGPLPYVKLKENFKDAEPIIHFKEKNGNSFYTCSFVKFLNTQKIKKIALTQPLSTCGYLSVNYLLNYKLEDYSYNYLGKHDDVALNIIKGNFDAGGLKSSIAQEYFHLGLEEISKTENLPGFALVANNKTLDDDFIKELKDIFLKLDKNDYSKWGKNIKYGFETASDNDYDVLRKMLDKTDIKDKDKN